MPSPIDLSPALITALRTARHTTAPDVFPKTYLWKNGKKQKNNRRPAPLRRPLRPDVVWFGETLPAAALDAALQASRACDLFLCIGTSALVQPAASLPYEALRRGSIVVGINPNPTPLSTAATHTLSGPAGQLLPALLQAA